MAETLKTAPSRRAMLTGSGALLAGVTGFLAAAAAPGAAQAAEGADAELVRICAEHIKNFDAYNNDKSDLEADDNLLWQAYEGTRDAISDAEPQTIVGVLAKARAAKSEARGPGGEEQTDGRPAEWAWDIVNDLIRLGDAPKLAQVAA